jgi:hypothetical protein
MEHAGAPGVGAAAETSADCLFPSPALPGSGSMGIISAASFAKAAPLNRVQRYNPRLHAAAKFGNRARGPQHIPWSFVESQLI